MKYYSDKNSIKISYTDSDWDKLIKNSKVPNLDNEESVRKVFCLAFEWFLQGKYSIDELSSVCAKLFDVLPNIKNDKYPELFDALDSGLELAFYIRKPDLLSQFTRFLEDIFNIYENLKNYPKNQ